MKEESRQEKLAKFRETGQWPGMKGKPAVSDNSWSIQQERRDRKADRKRKKELKRQALEKQIIEDEDDEDNLDEDYRLLKRMRKKVRATKGLIFSRAFLSLLTET